MGGSNFDLLVQEVLKQQRIMEELEKENRGLRRQLADLRAGRGILIEICSKSFTLGEEVQAIAPPAEEQPAAPHDAEPPAIEDQEPPVVVPAEPSALAQADGEPEAVTAAATTEQEPAAGSTFLEEIMLDEFAAASTKPMAVWTGPISEDSRHEEIDEEQKARLRRELMGSFLLE